LKATADAEEATGFDPSGSSALNDGYGASSAASAPDSSPDTSATSRETELSSLSNAVSSLGIADDHSASAIEDLQGIDQLNPEAKAQIIKDLFPSLSDFTISHALKKHHNAFRGTLDVLLNQVYLSENASGEVKGIDAFLDQDNAPRGRKKKKGKRLRLDEQNERAKSLSNAPHDTVILTNRWQSSTKNVDFIASHLNLPKEKVSSIYYQENASMQRTITSILEDWLRKNHPSNTEDPCILVDAYQLGRDFPTISERHRIALIGITQPSTAGAHELAEALSTNPPSESQLSQRIIPQYSPLNVSDDEDTIYDAVVTGTARSSLDFAGASTRAITFDAAREAAMTQARAAYRKSKSNPLMGGAAAYYSQRSREMRDSSQAYNSSAADLLVASQSSATHIDLHGVNVEDARRITHIKVNQWWDRLGENKVNGRIGANDRAAGFRIVTGAGKHSKGGRGVLGPAVKKMLEQEGWRIENMTGEIVVKGKAR